MPSDFPAYTAALRQVFRGRPTTAALKNPTTNLEWSLRILIEQGYQRCGTWDTALMAYFTGRCNAPSARDATGTTGASYVARVRARAAVYADLDAPISTSPADPASTLSNTDARITALEARMDALSERLNVAATALRH